jgi:methyl-accepting chemotaxis protein
MLSTIAPRVQTQVKEALKPITAQRMGAGAVSKRALSAPLKDEMKSTAESAAEANTLATTANTNANQAKETANSALSAANQAKDTASSASGTASTAKDTADATNNSLLLLEYKIKHASSFEDLKESI